MMDHELPGCVWPEWKFVKQIGRGAYGTVYEAIRQDEFHVESRAAIKVISIPQDESELDTLRTEGMDREASRTYMRKVVDAFVNEINLMITLKGSPNIVNVEDYKVVEREHEIGWDISIRMELLTPLYSYIADKSLSEKEVAQLGCDICSALEICAKKRIIHRDIKSGNIFINEFGDFKLGDFGIARQMESLTTSLSRKGTGSYMAPEVEKGLSYDGRADIYSLGLVLYLLLNRNRMPFLDPNKQILTPNDREQAIRRRLGGEPLPAPCDASRQMSEIILCACAYDPRRRFATPTAMKTALHTTLNGPAPAAGQEGPSHASEKQAEKEDAAATPTPSAKALAAGQTVKKQTPKRKRRIVALIIILIVAAVACVYFGLRAVSGMRAEKYEDLVQQQIDYRSDGDYAMEEAAYEEAVDMFPSNLEAYCQHAKTLHEEPASEGEPDYDACISYIEDDIFDNDQIDQTVSGMAGIWYLYADSYFESGDYSAAVDAYRELFQIGTAEPAYYQGYAIALAYDGLSSRAEAVLAQAEDMGLGDEYIYYTMGEVEKARSENSEALEDFSYCTRLSTDGELSARAYLACAEIYREEGDFNRERDMLLDAQNYSSAKLPQILQDLIQADMDLADQAPDSATASSYREEAIGTLKRVEENGWETFQTYNNLVFLYQQEGNLTEAEDILQSIQDTYGMDYRWYKRYAFLEIAKQERMDNANRDYTMFGQYYREAASLYNTYLSSGGAADNEMDVLEKQYEDVKNGGWLS